MELLFEALAEPQPGPRWQENFAKHWPAYRRWFEAEGIDARPGRAEGEAMLRRHMPELMPSWERLCGLVSDDDEAVRFLTLYRPPAYLGGCSQVVWTAGEPVLIRNYDYSPALCEGVLLLSRWNGRNVLAMSDCLWGALDGVNDSGLAISLTFGGRQVVGDGFGIPLILRYILEFCGTVAEATEVLARVPSHMAYNVTAIDRSGSYITAFVAPDRPTLVRPHPIATNHQEQVEWAKHAEATATIARERYLVAQLSTSGTTVDSLAESFLYPPLFTDAYAKGFGTLYTALYWPRRGEVELRWPGGVAWRQSFDRFERGTVPRKFGPEG